MAEKHGDLSLSITEVDHLQESGSKKELPPWTECMTYGSERFSSATANNHNITVLVESSEARKVVLGKDVVLTLPNQPEQLDIAAGYPTHQEAWLPLWYIATYHSQARTPEQLDYQREILANVTEGDFELVRKALAYKASVFLQEYKEITNAVPLETIVEDSAALRKRFKSMSRVLQDIMLYSDLPREPIKDHTKFLQESPLAELVMQANALRRGVDLDKAALLEERVEELITDFVESCGGLESTKAAYTQLTEQLAKNSSGSVFIVDEEAASIEQGPLYAHLVNPALTLAMDDHDHDVISAVPGLEEPKFFQIEERFGERLTKTRRLDVIAIPENIGPYDLVTGGKESFQSIAMMIVTHTSAETETGRHLQERLSKEFTPEELAKHYLGAAKEFMDGCAWGKSYSIRSENQDIPPVKKSIPLHRVGRDLLPRAVYMLKTGEFPHGVEDAVLWEEAGLTQAASIIESIWEKQDASEEELQSAASQIRDVLGKYYTRECTEFFESNLKKMGTSVDLMQGHE